MDDTAEASRLTGDLIRFGVVAEVDGARMRVRLDAELETDWLPVPTVRAGRVRVWLPMSAGEQVLLLCPEGDVVAGVAPVSLFSSAVAPPSTSADQAVIAFDDGARFTYDMAAQTFDAVLPGKGRIEAAGGLDLVADVKIGGQLEVTGKVTARADVVADGDVKAGSISLKNHKHGGVQAGGSQSGTPV